MVAYKAAQLRRYLAQPPSGHDVILFYGPDAALVSDNAAQLAAALAAREQPPGDIISLAEADLAEDPGRLAVEARTLPLFGGRKVVRVPVGTRFPADVLEALLDEPLEAVLILEAGNLRPAARLRKAVEGAKRAAALPCYELSARDMAAFIEAELAAAGVTASQPARALLASMFGGDQARARAELEKLALYAGEGGRLEVEDIDALIGDVTQAALDRFSICTANGQGREALRQLDRLSAAGQSPQGAMSALARHFERLHRVCAAVEAGSDLKTALGRIRPPLHFRQRDALEAQARRWSARQCARAIHLATRATERARLNPELERALAERLVITLSSH